MPRRRPPRRLRTSSPAPRCFRVADSSNGAAVPMSATIETGRINLLGLTRPQLEKYVADLGSKPFRARQLMNWIYKRGEGRIEEMTDLAKDFRTQLAQIAEVRVPPSGEGF